MTTWHWVRHGPTHAKGMVGWSDLPADLGDKAALARLDAALPRDALVVSSDLQRCVATADAIQKGRKRLPHEERIREIHFGDWELRNFADIAASDPDLSRSFWQNPGDVTPPGGESWNATAARVSAFVDEINARHSGRDIIAVGHFGVILTQVQRAARLDAASALSFEISNLSVTRLQFTDPHWRVRGVNHLV